MAPPGQKSTAASTDHPPALLATLPHVILQIHLRDGSTQTFVDKPRQSRRYYTGAFLSRNFQNRKDEDIRAHHLDYDLFCKILCSDFDITFPGDNIHIGYVYRTRSSQLQRDPKFIIIDDELTFYNCLSVLSNSNEVASSVSLSAPTIDLHIFNPKMKANSILPAMISYIDSMADSVSSKPPVPSTSNAPDPRPVLTGLPHQPHATRDPAAWKEFNDEEEAETDLIEEILKNDDGDFFDDVNNVPSMMHFSIEDWREMCRFFRGHNPQHVHYRKGHFVKCPGLRLQARPYQAYIVWYMFKTKTEYIDGCILAEGIGMGKTFETMLYCWVQTAVVAAGQDMERSRSELATAEMRGRHLNPGTEENPQDDHAKCPSQNRWGVQCPCVESSLSATLYPLINVGPVLIAVPPKLIPQWRQEYEQIFDPNHPQPSALRMQLFVEHHEHSKHSFVAQSSANPNIKKENLQYNGSKSNCTRFIVLTASNKTISSRVADSSIYKSRDPTRSFWSVFFWDEFHESRNPSSLHCKFFSKEMLLRPKSRTYPSIIGLSGTPIVRSVKDITCLVQLLQDDSWLQKSSKRYVSCATSIDHLAKRYIELLKEGESARVSGRTLTKTENKEEKEKRRAYSVDLNEALLPIMVVRRSTDLWFGQPIVDLPKLMAKYVMVDTDEEYLPHIRDLAVKAKAKADTVWAQKLVNWKRAGSKNPAPVRNDSSLKTDAIFIQVRFCASFPAFGKLLQSADSTDEFSLLASYIQEHEIYTTTDEGVINSTWYGKHFSQLIEGSQKLEELQTFLDEMESRSSPEVQAAGASGEGLQTTGSKQEKMIIGCSGPPMVAALRLWFLLKRKNMPAITLHPGISNDARGALVRSFNELTDDDGKYENPDAGKARVLIANMKLLSTGYNIQRANNVCIFDLPWTPDQWAQTVGRAYRSGQTRVVRVKTFVALGNGIEGRIYYALQTHKEVTDLSFNITNGENEKKENEKREQEQRAFVRQKRQEQIEAAASIV